QQGVPASCRHDAVSVPGRAVKRPGTPAGTDLPQSLLRSKAAARRCHRRRWCPVLVSTTGVCDAWAEDGRCTMKMAAAAVSEPAAIKDNEFRVTEVTPGSASLVGGVAVFN